MRPHVAALYAFARAADDFADEGDIAAAERHRLLDDWHRRLLQCVSPVAGPAIPSPSAADVFHDQIFAALGQTIRGCRLPVALFEDLLSAFRQDVDTRRYATWDDVLDYCRRSANPVGRLVLRIAGYDDSTLDRSSDALCTALQLTNFWQDLERDWQRGRLYVPLADVEACGAQERALDDRRLSAEWRCALQRAAGTTRSLFAAGRAVCDGVDGRLRLELRATWLGGMAILNRLESAGFDVFAERPALGARDVVALFFNALRWRAATAPPA
jgi:squalene synthase HpnC